MGQSFNSVINFFPDSQSTLNAVLDEVKQLRSELREQQKLQQMVLEKLVNVAQES